MSKSMQVNALKPGGWALPTGDLCNLIGSKTFDPPTIRAVHINVFVSLASAAEVSPQRKLARTVAALQRAYS
jgi:hypothetical protein